MAKLRTRQYRLLVFDWDGTLADSTTIIAQALQSACRDVGCEVPGEASARFVIGLGLADALAHVAPALPVELHSELTSRYRHHYLARDPEIALFAGARELLDDLHDEGFLLAIATGKTRAGLDRALAANGLAERFHATRCADEERPKPHPDLLLHLMARFDVAPAATLMIGDTTHDLMLARAAGVDAVAVTYGAHGRDGLVAAQPLATVHSIHELREWLHRHA